MFSYEISLLSLNGAGVVLLNSATSAWVQVSPQSELLGPSSADSFRALGLLPDTGAAIDVLIEV